jgi:hypothetical protein
VFNLNRLFLKSGKNKNKNKTDPKIQMKALAAPSLALYKPGSLECQMSMPIQIENEKFLTVDLFVDTGITFNGIIRLVGSTPTFNIH